MDCSQTIGFHLCILIIFYVLKSCLSNDVPPHLYSKCSSNKIMVKGFDIKISEVLAMECIGTAKFIEIFALNKLIIDADIDKEGFNAQLSVIAPTFEIIGRRKMNLNGGSGESHSSPQAHLSIGNGRDGKPGNPGGTAGSLLVIGEKFINEKQCEIHVNGGSGGAGQDGGAGM